MYNNQKPVVMYRHVECTVISLSNFKPVYSQSPCYTYDTDTW